MERSGGDVRPVPVVNQETNGGEPKQMLTGCLVNSTLPSGIQRKNRDEKDRKGEFKKKILPQSNTCFWPTGEFKCGLTSELNQLFIDRTNRALRWQGEGELHVKTYLGDTDSERSHVALEKFLHPEVLQSMLSRKQFYYLTRGSAGPEAARTAEEC